MTTMSLHYRTSVYTNKKPDKTTRNIFSEFITPLEKGLAKYANKTY